jgi:hypothetical protein
MEPKQLALYRCKKPYWEGEFPVNKGTIRLLNDDEQLPGENWEEICVYSATDSIAFTPYAPKEPT